VSKNSKNYEENVIVTRKKRNALDVYTLKEMIKYVFLIMNAFQKKRLRVCENLLQSKIKKFVIFNLLKT